MTTESDLPDLSVFRPDRPGIRKVLGDLEADIMEVIWARPADKGTTVREVFEILHKDRSIAYTTVMTTMARLAKKRLLRAEKHEQTYVYYANFTQDEFILRFVRHVLENLLVSFAGPTLDWLDHLPDQNAADHARRLLAEIARRRAEEEGE
ncbi:MAG: BlaI/MecI/CopY family transcriptional regulator [Aggregatilineales bacterium]